MRDRSNKCKVTSPPTNTRASKEPTKPARTTRKESIKDKRKQTDMIPMEPQKSSAYEQKTVIASDRYHPETGETAR